MGKERVQLQIKTSDDIMAALDRHLERTYYTTRAAWYADAAEEWLEWRATEAEAKWQPLKAPSSGERIHISITPELKERLKEAAGPYQLVDIYWSIIMRYLDKHDILKKEADETPAVLTVSLLKEQSELIDAYVEDGTFESKGAFWIAAIVHWDDRRTRMSLPYGGYYVPPIEDAEDVYAVYPRWVHALIKMWSLRDNVSSGIISYNAIVGFLDALIDDPELAKKYAHLG